MATEFAGKVIVVTGGAEQVWGEGLTAAEALLRAGASVFIWDDDADALARAEVELRDQGLRADFRQVDIADEAQVRRAYDAVRNAGGRVDGLVNAAVLKNSFLMGPENPYPYRHVDFWDLLPERFRRIIDVNVLGMYLCTSVVARDMVARKSGSIINVSTSDRTKTSPKNIAYGPSKAMVEAFSLAAARQLKAHGVRLNVICADGRVNHRHMTNPENQPFDVMVPVIRYLLGDGSKDVYGQVFSAAEFNRSFTGERGAAR
jgi:NAD(P)-dependent dehydrogenase (short-subunit alcohol dehydrogenase family)